MLTSVGDGLAFKVTPLVTVSQRNLSLPPFFLKFPLKWLELFVWAFADRSSSCAWGHIVLYTPANQDLSALTYMDANTPERTQRRIHLCLKPRTKAQPGMHLHSALKRLTSALVQFYLSGYYFQWKFSLLCRNRLVTQQDMRSYFWPLTGLSNFFGVTGSYMGFFSGKGSSLQQRRTQALTSLDTESIRTYWEVWGCCCWPHRCFLCPTCQRRSPSTSPFCPCGWLSDGGAAAADSSWARAHQCKWCGDLQKKKKQKQQMNSLTSWGNSDCCDASDAPELHSWHSENAKAIGRC